MAGIFQPQQLDLVGNSVFVDGQAATLFSAVASGQTDWADVSGLNGGTMTVDALITAGDPSIQIMVSNQRSKPAITTDGNQFGSVLHASSFQQVPGPMWIKIKWGAAGTFGVFLKGDRYKERPESGNWKNPVTAT